jgi:GNAT superfamily N-acetyltransferase
VELELSEIEPDDPAVIALLGAMRAEVDARGAHADPTGANARRSITDVVRDDRDLVVAYAGTEAVGIAALRDLAPEIGEIKRMYVVPAYRGSGVARLLLEDLERRARAHGFRAVRLDTHDRLTEAVRLYRRAGYRQIQDYNSNPSANIWFEKSLP